MSAAQDAFEALFPIPHDCIRCGERYAATHFNAWDAHAYINKFDGFKAAYALVESTKRAALAGMDAATSASSIRLEEAARLRAESSPEALASERAANAILTDENDRLRAEKSTLEARLSALVAAARNDALVDAAHAMREHNREGRGWIPGSLWGTLTNEAAARILALKVKRP
jgi:predicted  nucleic acid-binding Zn-ribbon protein